MLYMRKTQKGTISAKRLDNGITVGIYGKESVASLECKDKKIVLLVNEDNCKENNIDLVITNKSWEPKQEEQNNKTNSIIK